MANTRQNWKVCVQDTTRFLCSGIKISKDNIQGKQMILSLVNNVSAIFLIIKLGLLAKPGQNLPCWIKPKMLVWNNISGDLPKTKKESLEEGVLQFRSFSFPWVLQHWFCPSQPGKRCFKGTLWNVVLISMRHRKCQIRKKVSSADCIAWIHSGKHHSSWFLQQRKV